MGKTTIKKDLLNVYSEEEKVIGTWVNGKPIYRKKITIPALSVADSITIPINNMENVISFFGLGGSVPFPYVDTGNTGGSTFWYINADNDGIRVGTGPSRNTLAGYGIVEYTKTTD